MKVPLSRLDISSKEIDYVLSVLNTAYLTLGPKIDAFEKTFAKYLNVSYVLATSSGTAGLHLAVRALNISDEDEVITSPCSCRDLLHEIFRVLKPGGFVLLGCPNIANLRYRISLLFGKSYHSDIRFWHNVKPYFGYYREYTPSEIRYMLQEAGFTNIRVETNEKRLLSLVKHKVIQRKNQEGRKGTSVNKMSKKEYPFYLACVLYYLVANSIPGLGYSIRATASKPTG